MAVKLRSFIKASRFSLLLLLSLSLLVPLMTKKLKYRRRDPERVLKYKIDADLANNNEAVVKLIKKGLKSK
jgi:hypothetical protein